MIRTKGEPGTGDIVEAVRHMRQVNRQLAQLSTATPDQLMTAAKDLQAPYELVKEVAASGKLPVVNFAAGGIATPADAALMMQLGCDGIFVGSGVFKSDDPVERGRAIVEATTHYKDAAIVAKVSSGLAEPMSGIAAADMDDSERMQHRGW